MARGHNGGGRVAARLVDGDSKLGHEDAIVLFMEANIVMARAGKYGHAI